MVGAGAYFVCKGPQPCFVLFSHRLLTECTAHGVFVFVQAVPLQLERPLGRWMAGHQRRVARTSQQAHQHHDYPFWILCVICKTRLQVRHTCYLSIHTQQRATTCARLYSTQLKADRHLVGVQLSCFSPHPSRCTKRVADASMHHSSIQRL